MKTSKSHHATGKVDRTITEQFQAVKSFPTPDNATKPAAKKKRKGRIKRAMSSEARDRMVAEQRAQFEKIMADRRDREQLSPGRSKTTASPSSAKTRSRARVLTPEARAHLDAAMKERYDWIMAERRNPPRARGSMSLREALKAAAEARKAKAKIKARAKVRI